MAATFTNSLWYRARSRLLRHLAQCAAFRRWRREHLRNGLTCRACSQDDLPGLAELYREMKPSAEPRETWRAATDEFQKVSAMGGQFLVALRGGRVAAYLTACPELVPSGEELGWYIHGLYVARTARACGVGELLVEELCRRASNSRVPAVTTHVFEANTPAMRFFTKMGFTVRAGRLHTQGYHFLQRDLDHKPG